MGATGRDAYHGIAEVVRGRIAAGLLAPGDAVPSETALSEEFRVARNTVRRALAELHRDGLLTVVPGRGRIVRAPGALVLPRYQQIANDVVRSIVRGDLRPGDPLPSEADLMARHGVSRGTARHALRQLDAGGLSTPVPGKVRRVSRRA